MENLLASYVLAALPTGALGRFGNGVCSTSRAPSYLLASGGAS